jgi:hypothetical protein
MTKADGFEKDKRNKVVYPIETSTYCRTLVAFAQITLFVKMSKFSNFTFFSRINFSKENEELFRNILE